MPLHSSRFYLPSGSRPTPGVLAPRRLCCATLPRLIDPIRPTGSHNETSPFGLYPLSLVGLERQTDHHWFRTFITLLRRHAVFFDPGGSSSRLPALRRRHGLHTLGRCSAPPSPHHPLQMGLFSRLTKFAIATACLLARPPDGSHGGTAAASRTFTPMLGSPSVTRREPWV